MEIEKEFIINKFLSLKLEKGKTVIYIAGERFYHCKFLLIEIPKKEMRSNSLRYLNSIDEASEKLDTSLEPIKGRVFAYNIPPETEFWGHCSNIQAWYENGYDTRLLHSNLSFPLLEELTEAGDPQAKKVFKEEIAERYNNGIESVRKYLKDSNYLRRLTIEEFHSYIDADEYEIVCKLKKIQPHIDRLIYQYKKGKITHLMLSGYKLKKVPSEIRNLTSLEYLEMNSNKIEILPNWIKEFKSLKKLSVYGNQLKSLPETIGELKSLEIFIAFDNELERLPNSIGDLKSLITLRLNNNKLITLPETVGGLKNLKDLEIENNQLNLLPSSIGMIESLEGLILRKNKLSKLPDSIGKLTHLKVLSVGGNNLEKIPNSIQNLINLRVLNISENPLLYLPKGVYSLPNLMEINVKGLILIEPIISKNNFRNKDIIIL